MSFTRNRFHIQRSKVRAYCDLGTVDDLAANIIFGIVDFVVEFIFDIVLEIIVSAILSDTIFLARVVNMFSISTFKIVWRNL
jgi:hypothetical protein